MDDFIGVINIYKEKGFTSHDVVNIVRKQLGRVKTGHTGTLDPDAEGVLPVCVGKATKLAEYIAADIKEYKVEMTLGITTTTEDISGDVLSTCEVLSTKDEIIEAVNSFVGEYHQKPPMYSAVKVNGKKLYELAREGKEVERKTRLINIYSISEITFVSKSKLSFVVLCSKGTYIRTLCKDIGEKLGCGGCMSKLLRTRSGNFYIKDSIKINTFKEMVANKDYSMIISVEKILSGYKKSVVAEGANKYLYNGNKLSINFLQNKNIEDGDKVLLYNSLNQLIGVYEIIDTFAKPIIMLY